MFLFYTWVGTEDLVFSYTKVILVVIILVGKQLASEITALYVKIIIVIIIFIIIKNIIILPLFLLQTTVSGKNVLQCLERGTTQ